LTLAGLTQAVSTVPSVSTSRWRLTPGDLLAAVVAVQAAAVGGPDALTVDDASAGGEVTASTEAIAFA
jgi:archaellum component FlaG (FlaF/FlaG flagellin family)